MPQPVKVGSEFRINTLGAIGETPEVTALANGGFAVVWFDYFNNSTIRARIYNAQGTPIASEFVVQSNTIALTQVVWPNVIQLANGNLMFAWIGRDSDSYSYTSNVRVFSQSGTPVSSEIIGSLINVDDRISLASLSGGGALNVFDDGIGAIYSRIINSQGQPQSSALIAQSDFESYHDPVAVQLSDGRLLATWITDGNAQPNIQACFLNSSGLPISAPFQVGALNRFHSQSNIDVAALPSGSGRAIIVFSRYQPDTSQYELVARFVDLATGLPIGSETILTGLDLTDSLNFHSSETKPRVIASANGITVVTERNSGGRQIVAQLYDFNLVPVGPAFQIDDPSISGTSQFRPSEAVLADGRIVTVWYGDQTDYAIYGQILDPRGTTNNRPVANPDAYSTSFNTSLAITTRALGVLNNDTDTETPQGSLTASIAALPSHGTVAFSSNGTFNYIPTAGFSGTDSFNYFVNDGAQNSLTPATVTINVGALVPTVSIAADLANKPEGNGGGTTPFTFSVTPSGSSATSFTVFWQVGIGANPSADFSDFTFGNLLPSGSLTWSANDASAKTITVLVNADSVYESSGIAEQFIVVLTGVNGGPTLGAALLATGFIQNDDAPPKHTWTVTTQTPSVVEGRAETFHILRSGAENQETIYYSTTMTAGSKNDPSNLDYVGQKNTPLSFAIGQFAADVSVQTLSDSIPELDETYGFIIQDSATIAANPDLLTPTLATPVAFTILNNFPPLFDPAFSGVATTPENVATSSSVFRAIATDLDGSATLSYSISGGADAAMFNINATTGVVTFKTSPDFEAPTDAGANNVYDFIVQASDGLMSATKAVSITVTDVLEPAVPTPPFTDGPDAFSLGSPGRTWHAGAGNDFVTGTPGADTIFGDAGSDSLSGGDSLSLTAAQKSIYRLYGATLAREPDAAGLAGWVAQLGGGAALVNIAASFVVSSEFQTKYGALNNTQFVTQLYANVLHRAPDAGGLAGWVNQINGGSSRQSVVVGFSESAEYRAGTETATQGYATAGLYSATYGQVYRLYGATLNRAPDAAGFGGWVDILVGGQTLAGITTGFVNSTEFQTAYGSLNNNAFVTLLYSNVLHRAPDAAGLSGWVNLMNSGTSREVVVNGFSESTEYQGATNALLRTFVQNVMTSWADTLNGGAGDDVLIGGRGSDTFQFDLSAPGDDQVYGFEGWDILNFTGFGYASAAAATSRMTQSGADVLFSDRGETINFHNTNLAGVSGATFTFA